MPQPGFSCPGPCAGPRDLIVLKHSSYRQIFQCPLSLVSDLHICWNTVGCSLCSSDQLGISLALRGSGLCSHLSHRHLPSSKVKHHILFTLLLLSGVMGQETLICTRRHSLHCEMNLQNKNSISTENSQSQIISLSSVFLVTSH